MTTLADIRSLVRTQLDLDTTDLPDTLLDLAIREGYNRTIGLAVNWPSFETVETPTSVGNVVSTTADFAEVAAVIDQETGLKLDPIFHTVALGTFSGPFALNSDPVHYSTWGGDVYLWPTPPANREVMVVGYRKPNDWVTTGAAGVFDADSRLLAPVFLYACARAWAQQEDDLMEKMYMDSWQASAASAASDILRTPHFDTTVYGGGIGRHPLNTMVWDLP